MATEASTMATEERPVEVLLAGSDPAYLEQVAERVTEDGIQVHTVATTDPEAAIAQLKDGAVDCLIATYNPSANDGLPILEYLRDDSVEVPVILLPSGPTTVVVSENLVVDVASVFTREEAIAEDSEESIGPDVVVDAVEERQASEAARRRRGLERAIESIARELSDAGGREEVDRSLVEGMADTDEVDGAWMTEVDGEDVSVRTSAAEGTDAGAPRDGPARDAVKRAMAMEQPQVTRHDGANYAAVPVAPEHDEPGVLTMASESRYAFGDEETRVLSDIGDTASRAIDDVVRSRAGVPADLQGQNAFETVLEQLSVPVVAYGDTGWVAGANDSFAQLVGETSDDIVGQPVWEVLPAPRLETFEDYWASFSAGETRTQLVDLDAVDQAHQLVTTRVAVGEEEYNVSLAVEQVEESADPWFADVLAYEFRHWLAIAEDAMAGEPDDQQSEVVDAVVERMQDAMTSEVRAAQAGSRPETEALELDDPTPGTGAGAGATGGAGAGAGAGPGTGAGAGAGPGTGADAGAGAGAGADAGAGGAGGAGPGTAGGANAAGGGADGAGAAGANAGGAGVAGGDDGPELEVELGAEPATGDLDAEGTGRAGGADAGGVDPAPNADAIDFGDSDDLALEASQLAQAAGAGTDAGMGTADVDTPDVGVEPQPVSGLARDAWMTVVGEFGEYEIRGERKVMADETMLHRLFAHLFRTLFSYGKASGVDVGVNDDGFFVADDGSGVPHEQREYAHDETMTDAKSGAGIRVARRLANRQGWDLEIESTDDGGSRFVVSGARIIED